MQGQRRPPQGGRPPGPPHGSTPHPQIQWAPPKLWSMQTPKLPAEEPFIPDLYMPNGTDQEDKLSIDMIEHGFRDPPFVRRFSAFSEANFCNELPSLLPKRPLKGSKRCTNSGFLWANFSTPFSPLYTLTASCFSPNFAIVHFSSRMNSVTSATSSSNVLQTWPRFGAASVTKLTF